MHELLIPFIQIPQVNQNNHINLANIYIKLLKSL